MLGSFGYLLHADGLLVLHLLDHFGDRGHSSANLVHQPLFSLHELLGVLALRHPNQGHLLFELGAKVILRPNSERNLVVHLAVKRLDQRLEHLRAAGHAFARALLRHLLLVGTRREKTNALVALLVYLDKHLVLAARDHVLQLRKHLVLLAASRLSLRALLFNLCLQKLEFAVDFVERQFLASGTWFCADLSLALLLGVAEGVDVRQDRANPEFSLFLLRAQRADFEGELRELALKLVGLGFLGLVHADLKSAGCFQGYIQLSD